MYGPFTYHLREYEDEIDEIINDKYGDKLTKKDQEIYELNQKLTKSDIELTQIKKEYKSKIEKLNSMDDLNTPQAKKILSSLLVLLK